MIRSLGHSDRRVGHQAPFSSTEYARTQQQINPPPTRLARHVARRRSPDLAVLRTEGLPACFDPGRNSGDLRSRQVRGQETRAQPAVKRYAIFALATSPRSDPAGITASSRGSQTPGLGLLHRKHPEGMPESIMQRAGSFWHPFRMRSAASLGIRGSRLRSDTPATLCDHFVIKFDGSIVIVGRAYRAPAKSANQYWRVKSHASVTHVVMSGAGVALERITTMPGMP